MAEFVSEHESESDDNQKQIFSKKRTGTTHDLVCKYFRSRSRWRRPNLSECMLIYEVRHKNSIQFFLLRNFILTPY